MDWPNERYVRLYVRDTVTYKLLKWEGQCILSAVMRKLDRAGVLDLSGVTAYEAVEAVTDASAEFVRVGLKNCLDRGVFVVTSDVLFMPNFIDAQEAAQSDKARARASREKRRDKARLQKVTERDASQDETAEPQNVTGGSGPLQNAPTLSQNVTDPSQPITPYCAVPSVPDRAVPSEPIAPPEDFDSGHLEKMYDEESRDAGKGPYRLKRTEYDKAQSAVLELSDTAIMEGLPIETVARESIKKYFQGADKGLRDKKHPFWGWANQPAAWYFGDSGGRNRATPKGQYDADLDSANLLGGKKCP